MAVRILSIALLALITMGLVQGGPVKLQMDPISKEADYRIQKRSSPTVEDRPGCSGQADIPPNRVNTTERLFNLRQQFSLFNVSAYIVTSDNAHQSEYSAPHDHRREFISGFTGSAGTAVVTSMAAALWTDGRYYIQAEQQLDCNWILMKQSDAGVPSISQWLLEVMAASDDRAAADPTLIGADEWISWSSSMAPIPFEPLATNLIDQIWNASNGRPEANREPGYVLPSEYSGIPWEDKISSLRLEMVKLDADGCVISALDEVAWLFNIRGSDVPYEPMLLSYSLVTLSEIFLFVEPDKITANLTNHLNGDNCTTADSCVRIEPYDQFVIQLPTLAQSLTKIIVPQPTTYTGGSSFAVYNAIPAYKQIAAVSPVIFLKAMKNGVEAVGMKRAHLKDAVALCDFLSQMDEEVPAGVHWDELKASEVLLEYRMQQAGNKGASFETIAGFGANGAIIHYSPSIETNAVIDMSSTLLLDSGGQFYDGTTDVTRTMHFGVPTTAQRDSYTRVLMGHADLARAVIPRTVKDTRTDLLARNPLYSVGLDYLHGTGHGIGAFLSVHESPTYIGIGGTRETRFREDYFFSDEPGYYKEGEYGIRIESILRVVPARFETEFSDRFYKFEPVTLVPFEPKLIDTEIMTKEQIDWVNNYHSLVLEQVGPELVRQNRTRAYSWLVNKTACIGQCK